MPLTPTDLSTLSRLLDDAMDLPAAEVDAWFAALPEAEHHLIPSLRAMLAQRTSAENDDFLSDGPKLDSDDASVAREGDLVGAYRLIREIGRGGMGAVWLAKRSDGTLKREVALKLPRLAWGPGLSERMARERDIGALLEHPNIARLYDAGVDERGRPFLALEYIDGVALDAWCEAGPLPVRDRLRLFLQVARAVAYAHGRLVVHRDLKPSNVLVTADGQAHLLDFGIAKLLDDASVDSNLTQEQGKMLTPRYASPEQIAGETITVASDVYSLGVLLYELLCGKSPYETTRNTAAAIEEAVLEGEPAPASTRAGDKSIARRLRGELDATLAKALKREPTQRYGTVDAFAQDVERHLQGERVLAQPDTFAYRAARIFKRHRPLLAALTAILIAVTGGAGMSIVQAKRADASAERARVVKEFVVDVFKVNASGNGNSELRQLPAEMLLERGGRLIETRFAGKPDLQSELYGVVGGIFADMGATDLAVDYARRQVALLAVIDATRQEQGRALLMLGRALLTQGKVKDSEAHARRAVVLLEGDRDFESQARILLAMVLEESGELASARVALEAAEVALAGSPRPSIAHAGAVSMRASIARKQNRFDEAVPLYLASIDEAMAVEGALSPTAIETRVSLAWGMASFGRADDATRQMAATVGALRNLGISGQIRAALEEAKLAELMFSNNEIDFAEAHATMQRDQAAIESFGARVPQSVKAAMWQQIAMLNLDWGDIDTGDMFSTRAAAVLQSLAESPWKRLELASMQGRLARDAGRHDEADRWLREMLEIRMQRGELTQPFTAWNFVLVAWNLSMAGRVADARAVLATAPPAEAIRGAGTEPTAYVDAVKFASARVDLDNGEPAAALARPLVSGTWEYGIDMDARLLVGEAQCATGRAGEGFVLVQAGLATYQSNLFANNPYLARARSVAALCALASGQRSVAIGLAATARRAFAAQPHVSPYFKAPLQRFEQALAGTGRGRRPAVESTRS